MRATVEKRKGTKNGIARLIGVGIAFLLEFAGVFLYLLIGLNPKLMKSKRKYNQAHMLYTSKLNNLPALKVLLKKENPYLERSLRD